MDSWKENKVKRLLANMRTSLNVVNGLYEEDRRRMRQDLAELEETLLPRSTPEEAATRLYNQLTAEPTGAAVISVGTGRLEDRDVLLVYLRRGIRCSPKIPETFAGYAVHKVSSSEPKPARSE